MEELKIKIAIITAYIGCGGNSGELKINKEAFEEFQNYGIDLYYINDENKNDLIKYEIPNKSKKSIIQESFLDKMMKFFFKIKYRQTEYPSEETNRNRLLAKIPKICFYKLIPNTYDYYIWLDSKITIGANWLNYILWIIHLNFDSEIIISKHSLNNSVYSELHSMLNTNHVSITSKYNKAEMAYQVWKYSQSKYFVDDKLFECTMIIYNKSIQKKRQFLEEWYAHNYYYSIQDQLSFPYLIQKHRIKVHQIIQDVMNMPFCKHEYGQST